MFTQGKKTNSDNIEFIDFIVVVPVTVCKEVHGLANMVTIMI